MNNSVVLEALTPTAVNGVDMFFTLYDSLAGVAGLLLPLISSFSHDIKKKPHHVSVKVLVFLAIFPSPVLTLINVSVQAESKRKQSAFSLVSHALSATCLGSRAFLNSYPASVQCRKLQL